MHHIKATGSRAEVWHGNAKHTSGGLTKSALMKNKNGKIVSRRKHKMGKKTIKKLRKLGYVAKKGQFTLFKKLSKRRKGSLKGGNGTNYALSPTDYSGAGQGLSGNSVGVQFAAGNAN
jgi:hypothetical protein